jgi:predicted  nucleic acid-binding Zn-ribbon protein
MKSLAILLLAGLAVATQEAGAQAAAGNATDVQQGGDAVAEAGNNSTEVNQGADANAEADKENNNNNNNEENNNNNNEENNAANEVIQIQNGQQCINLEAVNDPKCVSIISPSVTHVTHVTLTRYSHSFDPASLNLGNMQLGGLNLGNINLADPISLAFGIDQLMGGFCLGQLVDVNTLLALGLQNQQQMFLELAQIAQLQQLGLVNVFGAQNLVQSNLFSGGAFNILNAGRFSLLLSSHHVINSIWAPG